MIQVNNLHKRFGEVQAVDGLSLDAPDGAITGLLGANGAGKSTTLRIICGLLAPDEGDVRIGGTAVQDDRLAAQRRIGALLDHGGLYPRLTAREHLLYFGRLRALPEPQLRTRVQELLDLLGLDRVADRSAAGFSQGERMKVALGRALVHQPGHVLLDEPTSGLDIPTVRAVRDLLRQLRDRGTCIILSSHMLDDVRQLCDRVVVIAGGTNVAEGTTEELCRDAGSVSLEETVIQLMTVSRVTGSRAGGVRA